MKRTSISSAKSKPKSVPAKRKPAAPKPVARKAPKPSPRKPASACLAPAAPDSSKSKQSQLIALLRATAGASMAAMTSLTGWQPHTVRGTISGSLRKRLGLNVQCLEEDGVRVYRIVEACAP